MVAKHKNRKEYEEMSKIVKGKNPILPPAVCVPDGEAMFLMENCMKKHLMVRMRRGYKIIIM